MSLFSGIKRNNVPDLPYNIDGICVYVLPCDPTRIMKSSKDGRPWKPWCTSKRSGHRGVRRRAVCGGSFRCPNGTCKFIGENGFANDVQFIKKEHEKVCFVCEAVAVHVSCEAVKIWEFEESKESVTIYHYGTHHCRAIPVHHNVKTEKELEDAFSKNVTLKPSEVGSNFLVNALQKGDWDEVDRIADTVADSKKLSSLKERAKKASLSQSGQSFDAVSTFKKFCDTRDPFYIYKMNDEGHNGQMSYVFKCSMVQAKLALSMDREKDGLLKDQYCYADAKHDRCTGFKTLTLWVYHPVMRKVVKLATMECLREDSEAVTMFWSLLNEVCTACAKIRMHGPM